MIGFMQGRMSPMADGKIQAFPWDHWRDEFVLGEQNGFQLMEWTLDLDRLYENPFMTEAGHREIKSLSSKHGVAVRSSDCECFQLAPFYKASGETRAALLADLARVIEAAADLGVVNIIVPLVDDEGRLEDMAQEDSLVRGLCSVVPLLAKTRVGISFEPEYPPQELARLMARLDPAHFGISYDIGNSAALGYDPRDEIRAYGDRIVHVHIKDRLLGGTTVPLGTGHADIPLVVRLLQQECGYEGNYILQPARAQDGNHTGALCRYRDMAEGWLREAGA